MFYLFIFLVPQGLTTLESKRKKCNIKCIINFEDYFFIYSDKSLEEFLDDLGLDNPLSSRRNSSDGYIQWGRRRSERVLMRNVPCLDFEGREVTIKSLLNNVCDSILNPTAKTPILFHPCL